MLSALSTGNAPTLTELGVRRELKAPRAAETPAPTTQPPHNQTTASQHTTSYVSQADVATRGNQQNQTLQAASASTASSAMLASSVEVQTNVAANQIGTAETATSSSQAGTTDAVSSARNGLVSLSKGFLGAAGLQAALATTDAAPPLATSSINEPTSARQSPENSAPASSAVVNPFARPFSAASTDKAQADVMEDAAPTTDDVEQPSNPPANASEEEPTAEQQQQITELESRDNEVRAHEQAHASIGGSYAGSPSFEYEQGPDGKRYATDGEVQIDVSIVEGDPEATMKKMRQVYSAAMAPNEPSSADIRVAAEAMRKYNQAREEAAEQRIEQINQSPLADNLAIAGEESTASTEPRFDNENLNRVQNAAAAEQQSRYELGLALIMSKVNRANETTGDEPSRTNISEASNTNLDNFTPPTAELSDRRQAELTSAYSSTNI